ncbi:pullulanase [Streptococcus orisratti]|uniref:pullulanase n=1 Tax=Streptococcus orisratti TaxID=114652 RepID=UPI0023F93253|nr:pullulanase [Streptococcus orisratti]
MPKKRSKSWIEKKEIFSIRKFKVGVASVAIAASFFALGQPNSLVRADEAAVQSEQVVTAQSDTGSTTQVTDLTASPETSQATTTTVTDEVAVATETGSSSPAETPALAADSQTENQSITADATPATTTPISEEQPSESASASVEKSTTDSTENVATVSPATTTEETAPVPIEEGNIRLHFAGLDDSAIDHYGLWTWGGVATPSDGNKWPTDAQPFVASQKDDYGYYIDVKQSENPASIGYLLLKDGEKVAEGDQKIEIVAPQMNEAWIAPDFKLNTYKPLNDEKVVRINYKRDDGNYDGWGLWLWGDTVASDGWPDGALDFTAEGQYGRYVDVPLSKALESRIGFLVVNQNNPELPGNKSSDMSFANRQVHSQIFLRNDEATVYTNPYYIPETLELDLSKAEPGKANISLTAEVDKAFDYNQHGILSISVNNPDNVDIYKTQVDSTAIGGGIIDISPELNKVTLNASSEVAAGDYELPVRVYDTNNGYYETKVKVTITEHQKKDGEKDWDEQIIYFMLTDRFKNGDTSNDNPYNQPYAQATNQRGVYQGGDFKGVTEKLDYLKELGVTSIWLTPIVENIPGSAGDAEYYAYHGYWASNFEKLNPHLGSLADFHELIDKAAEKGINIIVDVVLNHAGYGTEDTFKGLVRTPEENKEGDDQQGSLSGLPDFKTEDDVVRRQLVDWQTSWLERSTTAKGNSIYAFRVDTVKHVDDTTWQHFKNELAEKDIDFHLIGESWGANYKDTKGDLKAGTMDSLLDFGFKDIAKLLVNGNLIAANKELAARGEAINSAATLGQFLGSHDEDGFLYSINGDTNKLKLAATALLTAKGQPVIYYGEELGQSGANNWPQYDNRYDFDWSKVGDSDILAHYKKVLDFRNANSELLSRGEHTIVGGSDGAQWVLAKRSYKDDSAYILYSVADESKPALIEVSGENATLTDYYSGKTYKPQADGDKWFVQVDVPTLANGGTMLIKVANGDIISATSPVKEEEPIAQGSIRLHFKTLPSDNLDSLGLWTWDDVATPSSDNGAWPTGATSFANAKQDDYGYYLDVKMTEKPSKISLLINNTAGDNITGDKLVELISPAMNEAWFDENYNLHYSEPLKEGYIRINYLRTDGDYDNKALWIWGDVQDVTLGDWPDGINFDNEGKYGRYIDVKLSDAASSIGFLLLDESKEGDAVKIQPNDYKFADLAKNSQIFLRDDDATVYTNPYFINNVRVTGVSHISLTELEASFTTLEGADEASLLEKMAITDKDGQAVTISGLTLDEAGKKVRIKGDFNQEHAGYTLKYGSDSFTTKMSWQLKDSLYAYDGELGARVTANGSVVDATLWSPSADAVNLVVYDKDDQSKVIGKVAMTKGDKGQWDVHLADKALGLSDYRGYYYHYEITRGDTTVLVLDPYAKSLAEWNSDLADTDPSYKVAKAAFVDPSEYGPSDLTYANIPNFKQREDAVIYEAHVRDFTSDEAISDDLKAQFGTFAAFAERLDYLQDLGVTHIQLLPVMSYYFVNELKNAERLNEYASSNSNYNWGYDPQNYFSLTGMYSSDPTDPAKRIEEFKNLVNEIHKRGMGVILDVVYNHTAQTSLFEDLEPNYYHFMEADGTAKSSFGGGRLGTTHYMSRRVMVDSIKYLVDEFKVDGFRFDMMGDHDAAAIEAAYNAAKELNPNIIMLGEGWRTYTGDANQPEKAADQDWMSSTDTVAVFSDEIRNSLKSGYPNEGQPAFITTGARDIQSIFNDIKAQPGNFTADDPGDVIQYIAAHDNLTLFDIIAQSIKKDPSKTENYKEILQRQRLGNLLILTAQGTPFIHSGQEYGRTKQFKDEAYRYPVSDDKVPNKSHLLTNADGTPFDYPYYIHDSYDSSDAINHFDWTKATDAEAYPENVATQAYTKGLIALRKSTDAFRLSTKADVDTNVSLISLPGQNGIGKEDVVIAYQTIASNGDRYAVFVNADSKERSFVLSDAYKALLNGEIIVDGAQAGLEAITNPVGVTKTADSFVLAPLTAAIVRLSSLVTEVPDNAPTAAEKPELKFTTKERTETSPLEFTTHYQETTDLAKGVRREVTTGKEGSVVRTYRDVYVEGVLVASQLLEEKVVPAEDAYILIGIGQTVQATQTAATVAKNTSSAPVAKQAVQESSQLPTTGDTENLPYHLLGLSLLVSGLGLAASKKRDEKDA